ncbi:AAA family ATPase, partial [Streptomyces sp. IBSBF 2806]|uniref:AAA family ATPase n=1 Tax=Streptomyces sp. IBSBF 2806 TaxID=2903529 RepID=UPI003FA7874A
MHISRIEIRNFHNFRHLVIGDFPAHALIVGENGVGKSNLLEAIRLTSWCTVGGEASRTAAGLSVHICRAEVRSA